MQNYNWYTESDLSAYSGKWIAISEEKVIASSKSLKKLTEEVSEISSLEKVSFVKIPEKGEALIYFSKC